MQQHCKSPEPIEEVQVDRVGRTDGYGTKQHCAPQGALGEGPVFCTLCTATVRSEVQTSTSPSLTGRFIRPSGCAMIPRLCSRQLPRHCHGANAQQSQLMQAWHPPHGAYTPSDLTLRATLTSTLMFGCHAALNPHPSSAQCSHYVARRALPAAGFDMIRWAAPMKH